MNILQATPEDHAALFGIMKTSKYTRDFSNRVMFTSDQAYEKGWILKAVDKSGVIVGGSCVRHKKREPVTVLYFIAVEPSHRSQSIGQALIDEIMKRGPHDTLELNVAKENGRAVDFYHRLGLSIVSDKAIQGTAYQMRGKWRK